MNEIHEAHKTGIGGSSASVVWGCNPYRTAHDLYAACLGLAPETETTWEMENGNSFEPRIRAWYEAKTKRTGTHTGLIRSKDYPWMIAHLDWMSTDQWTKQDLAATFAEFKIAGRYAAKEWGAPESCQVPLPYFLQGQHYSIVTGIKKWDLCVSICGDRPVIYPCEHDDDIAAELIRKERAFWHDNVLAKVPPPVDGSDSCRQLLTQIYQKSVTPIDFATGETARLLNLFFDVRQNYQAEELNIKELSNKVRAAIGEREGLKTDRGQVTWRARRDGVRVFLAKEFEAEEEVA